MTKKALIIGLGGVGSFLVELIHEGINRDQIDFNIKFYMADHDAVELKNLKYQNFTEKDLLVNKAIALERFKSFIAIPKKITKKDLRYDLIIISADNNVIRKEVFEYCHENNKDFIDLRAEGRYLFATPKTSLEADMATLSKDTDPGSCQKSYEFEKNIIQNGNRICSHIGYQMLLNYLRKETNSKIFLKV